MLPQMPVLAAVAAWFAIATVSRRDTLRRRLDDGSALFALWLLGALAAYSLLPYQAPRYFVPLAFALVACAAAQLAEMLSRPEPPPRLAAVPRFVFLVFLGFAALDVARHLERRLGMNPGGSEPHSVLGDALEPLGAHVAWGAVIAALLFAADLVRRRIGAAGPSRRQVAATLVAAILVVDLAQWARWSSDRTWTIEQAKESVAAIVGPDAVLAGGYAPLLTIGSGRLAVPQFGGWKEAPALSELGVTHVLLLGDDDRRHFEKRFPAAAGRLARIQRWPMRGIWVTGVELHRLPPDVGNPAYAPTEFERAADAFQAKEWDAALDLLQRVRRATAGPPPPDVLVLEADCYWALGNLDAARERLLAAVARRPSDPVLHVNLGVLAWRQGDEESARAHWTRALRLDPRSADVRALLRKAAP
jgi:hypothetical protein